MKNAFLLAGGTAFGQIIIILSSPFLTRLYTPEDFGVLAVFAALLGIISVAASLRYEFALPLPESDVDAANLLVATLLIVVFMSCFFGWLFLSFETTILQLTNSAPVERGAFVFALGVFSMSIYRVLNFWAVRVSDFNAVAKTKLGQAFSLTATQIGFGLVYPAPLGLILGFIVGQSFGIGIFTKKWLLEFKKFHFSFNRMRRVCRRYIKFPVYSSWSGVLNSAGLLLPSLLLANLYGAQTAGWFVLAERVTKVPVVLVSQSISQVYMSEAPRLLRENPSQLKSLFSKVSINLLVFSIFVIAPVALLSPLIFPTIFGANWRLSGIFVALLTPMLVAQMIVSPVSMTLNILEKQGLFALLDGIRVVAMLTVFLFVNYLDQSQSIAVLSYSLVMAITYATFWLVTRRSIK